MHQYLIKRWQKTGPSMSRLYTITATFGIELIYGGKNLQSLPRFEFPKAFPLSANEKYFSNTKESLKFLDEFIIPYVTSECKRKELDVNHPALLLMDVFRGQMMDPVLFKLQENSILLV